MSMLAKHNKRQQVNICICIERARYQNVPSTPKTHIQHTHTHIYNTHTHTQHTHTQTHTHTHTHAHMHTLTYTHTHLYTHIQHTHTHTHTHTYNIHTQTHTCTHTLTYTYIPMVKLLCIDCIQQIFEYLTIFRNDKGSYNINTLLISEMAIELYDIQDSTAVSLYLKRNSYIQIIC